LDWGKKKTKENGGGKSGDELKKSLIHKIQGSVRHKKEPIKKRKMWGGESLTSWKPHFKREGGPSGRGREGTQAVTHKGVEG